MILLNDYLSGIARSAPLTLRSVLGGVLEEVERKRGERTSARKLVMVMIVLVLQLRRKSYRRRLRCQRLLHRHRRALPQRQVGRRGLIGR